VTILDKIDLSQRMDQKQYALRLIEEQRRLLQLRLHLGGHMGDNGPELKESKMMDVRTVWQ
jgi:hypothetical protein